MASHNIERNRVLAGERNRTRSLLVATLSRIVRDLEESHLHVAEAESPRRRKLGVITGGRPPDGLSMSRNGTQPESPRSDVLAMQSPARPRE